MNSVPHRRRGLVPSLLSLLAAASTAGGGCAERMRAGGTCGETGGLEPAPEMDWLPSTSRDGARSHQVRTRRDNMTHGFVAASLAGLLPVGSGRRPVHLLSDGGGFRLVRVVAIGSDCRPMGCHTKWRSGLTHFSVLPWSGVRPANRQVCSRCSGLRAKIIAAAWCCAQCRGSGTALTVTSLSACIPMRRLKLTLHRRQRPQPAEL